MTTAHDATPVLFTADVGAGSFRLREAARADLPAVVQLLADDALGAGREAAQDMAPYELALDAINADPAHVLVVGELVPHGETAGAVVATFQLSYLPGISRHGAWRSQIEGVRVADAMRGQGLGKLMVGWAIAESRRRGCTLMQLTTHHSRAAAQRFYGQLGFEASHIGMKLAL
ncbi:N-acetyltransferase family protein [Pseudarthrobacter sp. C4D7]|uniref:GNAT family N-acetyltransferase n=1 Tax=Pseudarthrobacter sp. C4D7 TaxID=2735268 RepID=UPI003530432B